MDENSETMTAYFPSDNVWMSSEEKEAAGKDVDEDYFKEEFKMHLRGFALVGWYPTEVDPRGPVTTILFKGAESNSDSWRALESYIKVHDY